MFSTLLNLLPIPGKDAAYIAVILAIIGGAWYILDDWHYKPLRVADETILMLGNQLNTCIGIRDQCKADKDKENVENYQDGLGEGNEEFNFDLDNLSS